MLKRVLDDMKFAEFPWPRLADSEFAPVWVGNGFRVGSEFSEILSYGESESAWSDELTAMHEAEATPQTEVDAEVEKVLEKSKHQKVALPKGH